MKKKINKFKNSTHPRLVVAGSQARRAPLAERSAVNRQVLGSIPSAGVLPSGNAAARG